MAGRRQRIVKGKEEEMKTFGQLIVAGRKAAGLTQKAVAAILDN